MGGPSLSEVVRERTRTQAELAVCPLPGPLIQCQGPKLKSLLREKNMAISQELLDILVCPVCKAPVKFTPDNSGLKCQTCKRVYPVRDEIPVMLPEEAKIAAE
jgi:uncharacterized protein